MLFCRRLRFIFNYSYNTNDNIYKNKSTNKYHNGCKLICKFSLSCTNPRLIYQIRYNCANKSPYQVKNINHFLLIKGCDQHNPKPYEHTSGGICMMNIIQTIHIFEAVPQYIRNCYYCKALLQVLPNIYHYLYRFIVTPPVIQHIQCQPGGH